MTERNGLHTVAVAALAALSLMLSGCLLTPGRFTSELVLEQDGSFAFSYDGEIFFLGLSKLAALDAAGGEFEAEACYDDEYEERECTAADIARQREEWDAGAEERAEKAKKDAKEMAAMMGGIDPTDPQAAEEVRKLLLRHKGWNRVEFKGDGLFDVSYSARGKLSHDFMFPVLEGFPTTNYFVQLILREGDTVRINAPGFAASNEANPMGAMMGGMAGLAAMGSGNKLEEAAEGMPQLDGVFRIRTRGEILANNTDEGAAILPTGERVLEWKVSPRTQAAPTALVKLGS